MRKLVFFNLMTLDGIFEGPNRDIGWHNVDEEFNEFAIEQLRAAGELVFGRVTYQLMAGYWPTAGEDDPVVAELMNATQKAVFSRTLDRVEWNNTRLIQGEAADGMRQLKEQPGGLLCILGSANLSATFIQHGLIDEYRIMVNPLLLGKGIPLFQGLKAPLKLVLTDHRAFRNGNVLLSYQPE